MFNIASEWENDENTHTHIIYIYILILYIYIYENDGKMMMNQQIFKGGPISSSEACSHPLR